jgi:hypothetical protein
VTGTPEVETKPRDLEILDALIEKGYKPYSEKTALDIKLGELVKMIETRRKLTPQGGDQKEFWKMIDNLRKKALEKPKPVRKSARNTKGTK